MFVRCGLKKPPLVRRYLPFPFGMFLGKIARAGSPTTFIFALVNLMTSNLPCVGIISRTFRALLSFGRASLQLLSALVKLHHSTLAFLLSSVLWYHGELAQSALPVLLYWFPLEYSALRSTCGRRSSTTSQIVFFPLPFAFFPFCFGRAHACV
jgi:hypothetical protein